MFHHRSSTSAYGTALLCSHMDDVKEGENGRMDCGIVHEEQIYLDKVYASL